MSQNLTSVLHESRTFAPSDAFRAKAHAGDPEAWEALCAAAREDPDTYWGDLARETLTWDTPFDTVCQWEPPHAQWFLGGRLNATVQCLDRHLSSWRRNKAALIWEGEPGDQRTLTFQQLHAEVCRFANLLRRMGAETGDRVVLYMPMIPELVIAMLGCARIGVTHSIVFGGFSSTAIRDRIQDAGARFVVTADGGWRRGRIVELKSQVDAALAGGCPTVERVVVVRRTGHDIAMLAGRDLWWEEGMATVNDRCAPVSVDSEHPLFILYTSGTTGKPKGVVHSTAGYLLGTAWTSKVVLDLQDDDTYWCTADIGWITGHSYIVYGPLQNGVTTFMYEGAPNHPEPDRFWDIIERHRVSVFYTAPTAIRAFSRWGDRWPLRHDLTSLRLLGTVGEPINPEAWIWYQRVIGQGRCPIVDTWWQTETGAMMIAPVPGVTSTPPGSATRPLPGIEADVVDREGVSQPPGSGGFLVIRKPWPSMLRTIWGDDERYRQTYWSQLEGVYFAGDGCRRDEDGNFWIMGRIDDVINVSGHRLGTAEIESALVSHPKVTEAAVIGRPDEQKGQAIVAFVTLVEGAASSPALLEELRQHVATEIGAIARPEELHITDALPKTRSGKIMRRLLQDIAARRTTSGDTTTLEDTGVLDALRRAYEPG